MEGSDRRPTKDERPRTKTIFSSLVFRLWSAGKLSPLPNRHKCARIRPIVIGLGADEPVVGQLFADVCHPAGDPADSKRGREQIKRQPQCIQQRRTVELDVRVKLTLGKVWVLGDRPPNLL